EPAGSPENAKLPCAFVLVARRMRLSRSEIRTMAAGTGSLPSRRTNPLICPEGIDCAVLPEKREGDPLTTTPVPTAILMIAPSTMIGWRFSRRLDIVSLRFQVPELKHG